MLKNAYNLFIVQPKLMLSTPALQIWMQTIYWIPKINKKFKKKIYKKYDHTEHFSLFRQF